LTEGCQLWARIGVPVDVIASLDAPCPPAVLFAWVDDLRLYPEWLDIVPRADPVDAADGDPGPAWRVDLRGRLGPLARSKRLRMVRTERDEPHRVTFERREHDGRSHSPWVLRATVDGVGAAATGGVGTSGTQADESRLTMELHYGGALWGPVLERLLGDAIERSRARLLACVAGGTPG
jgi:hypothetical protein